jgi:mono/diheme cytochrome c family protein
MLSLVLPLGSMIVTGCSKGGDEPAEVGGPGRMGGRMKGPGGGPNSGSRGNGRFAPVAANASASDIFAQKCAGCHGDKGQGANGPNLTEVSSDSDAELFQTIHDGKNRMPAFGKQMTEAQMKELVTYVKGLGKA